MLRCVSRARLRRNGHRMYYTVGKSRVLPGLLHLRGGSDERLSPDRTVLNLIKQFINDMNEITST